jgi:hypothetical protein
MHSIGATDARLCVAAAVTLAAMSLVAAVGASASQPRPRQRPVPLVVKFEDRGFRWGDAGIGAAAGFGAALVLAGSLALAGRGDPAVTRPRNHKEEQP